MARPHKKAGRAIQIESALSPDELARLCKDAADHCKIQLDDAKQGVLSFSVRSALTSKVHLMSFDVRLAAEKDRNVMRSRIRHYKTRQEKLMYLVPLGPKRMLGLSSYEKFMERFAALARDADANAAAAIVG